jgi:hypothetical protein
MKTSRVVGYDITEISICDIAPAIANAVYHATGRRISQPADHSGQAFGVREA